MLSLTPEIMAEWARNMGALVDRALAENPVRWIPEKAPARRSGIRIERKDGLLMPLPEPVQFAGECPGGRYVYVADPALAVRLLGHWTKAKAWAAVDLETSAGYRMLPGPDGARTRRWSGSDPFTSRIMLASVSVEPGTAVVFDMRGLMQETSFVAAFGRFLTECSLVVHNAGFEYGFFRAKFGVEPTIAYDTLVAHQMLTAGLKEGSGLDDVLTKYTGAVKEKKWQKFFIEIHPEAPIPNAAIAYSAGDVCLLLEVAQKIDQELFESGQYHIWTEIERPLMRWIHHASQVGVMVDADLLRGIQQELAIERDRHRQAFEGLAEGVLISSPAQLLKWFNERSPAALLTTERESFEELMLKVPNGTAIYRAAEAVLGFRGAEKLRSTYIEPYLGELVNPQTGKIHPRWKQASTATGRMACSEPNLMNIPSKGRYVKIRNAIVAPEGFTFAWLDYSQYEVRAIADESGEQRMIAVFEEAAGVKSALADYVRDHALPHTPEGIQELAEKSAGEFQALVGDHPELGRLIQRTAECDFHRRTASLLFRVPVNQVTKQQRADAKTVTFGLPYGAGPKAIAKQAKRTIDEARKLLKDYQREFPEVGKFLERCRAAGRAGMTKSAGGRIRRYEMPYLPNIVAELQKIKAESETDPQRWADLLVKWRSESLEELAHQMHQAKVRSIEREATNHPIQANNADATKLATVLAGPQLAALHPECAIMMWVHDEIVLMAPTAVVKEAARILEQCMLDAARRFIRNCPVDVSVSFGQRWGK
jgi:DNA polymerase I-like protein with 3'-5' exonuclease and polymerase domains